MRAGARLAAAATALSLLAPAAPALGVAAAQTAEEHGDAYYNYCLARQAWHRQDYADALRYMELAVGADPRSPDLVLDFARLHFDMNHPEEAAREARKASELAPDSAPPRRLLADALFMMALRDPADGDLFQQASQAYLEVTRLDPRDEEAHLNFAKLQLSRGDLSGGLDSLRRHLALAPFSEEGTYLAAQALIKLGRQEEAEPLLRSAIQRRPDSPQLGMTLVDLYESRGDLEAAERAAKSLLRTSADPVRVRLALVRLAQRMGKHAEAVDHLKEMSRNMESRSAEFSDADRVEVQLRVVQALMDAGRPEEAAARAEVGMGRHPHDPRFALRKGEALLLSGRTQEAEALFKEGLPAGPDGAAGKHLPAQISDTYLSAGARRERAGRIEEAEAHLRKAIEWNPQNAAALNYLGYMLADRGLRLDEAIDLIKRALERDPENGAYLDSLGWAYFKKRSYREAEKALQEAVAAMSEEPAIHAHLGDLYHATGRKHDAVRAWKEALARGAENPDEIRAKLAAAEEAAATPP